MTQGTHLWIFFGLVLGIVVLPGLDMAYVLGSALVGGRPRGLAAVAGLMAGGLCHVVMGTLGLAVVLALVPAAFNLVLVAGAVYVGYVGLGLWRGAAGFALGTSAGPRSSRAAFVGALATNLLNPKAYVFMLAVFPQFVRPEYGPLAVQAAQLGMIVAVTQGAVYGLVALVAASFRGWLDARPRASFRVARTVAALLVLVALATLVEGWRRA
jgi:threonine/homoserine/homoserine lactone efflux protein